MNKNDLPKDWTPPVRVDFFSKLRGYAFTGILVLAPIVLTLSIFLTIARWLDHFFVNIIPPAWQPEMLVGSHIPGTGLITGGVLLVFVGMLARNFIGRWLVRMGERIICAIPVVNSIYGAIKQITDTLSMSQSDAFREVVLIEYPRKGIYGIAFVTGKAKGHVKKEMETPTGDEFLNIFVPTTPNPTSGFFLFVPRSDVIPLSMSVEQGLKMVISAGIVTPTLAEGKAALKKD